MTIDFLQVSNIGVKKNSIYIASLSSMILVLLGYFPLVFLPSNRSVCLLGDKFDVLGDIWSPIHTAKGAMAQRLTKQRHAGMTRLVLCKFRNNVFPY